MDVDDGGGVFGFGEVAMEGRGGSAAVPAIMQLHGSMLGTAAQSTFIRLPRPCRDSWTDYYNAGSLTEADETPVHVITLT